ncbi:hypothetical protein D3C75_550540 [compost metagenome]
MILHAETGHFFNGVVAQIQGGNGVVFLQHYICVAAGRVHRDIFRLQVLRPLKRGCGSVSQSHGFRGFSLRENADIGIEYCVGKVQADLGSNSVIHPIGQIDDCNGAFRVHAVIGVGLTLVGAENFLAVRCKGNHIRQIAGCEFFNESAVLVQKQQLSFYSPVNGRNGQSHIFP